MTPVLEITDVTFRRDGRTVLDNLSLTVPDGPAILSSQRNIAAALASKQSSN